MQKQCRLQYPRSDIAPQDNGVKKIELAGVVKGIKDCGNQAEDVEMGGFRGSPAPEQNVNADPQVDQRNQPEACPE